MGQVNVQYENPNLIDHLYKTLIIVEVVEKVLKYFLNFEKNNN